MDSPSLSPGVNHSSSGCACLRRAICSQPATVTKDQGLAWLVLFWAVVAAFLTSGLAVGTFGTVNLAAQSRFNISVTQSSDVGTVTSSVKNLSGPLASLLVKKLSSRVVQILAGVFMVVGYGACTFAAQEWTLYLFYGVFAGLGISCGFIAYPAVLVHHFNRYKDVAFAVCALGDLIGGIIWPILSQHMFTTLGFSLTMGVLGLCEIPQIIAGFFFTEPKTRTTPDPRPGGENSHVTIDQTHDSQMDLVEISAPLIKQSAGSIDILTGLKILLTDWKVWCLILNFGLWNINLVAYLLFINSYVVKYCGLTDAEAALGVTVMGVGALVGTLLLLALGRVDFDRLPLFALSSPLYGASTIGAAFTLNTVMYYTLSAVWGMGRGILASTLYIVCVNFTQEELFPMLFGLNMFAQGLTGLAAGPLCGYFQTTIHPVAGLCFAGATGIAATLVLVPVILQTPRATTAVTRGETNPERG